MDTKQCLKEIVEARERILEHKQNKLARSQQLVAKHALAPEDLEDVQVEIELARVSLLRAQLREIKGA